ncbi:MAG: hypothetical protein ACD_68C00059G0001 [uncultured bacterium]|nr:MAG: hypothetical protein ACD_68C00059G0001 [uncultured bacterium]
MKNPFFIILGPSGVGKNAVIKDVLKKFPQIKKAITYTVRQKRKNEKQGRDHYFVTTSQFKRMIKNRMFYEWAYVHGRYYGTPKKELNELLNHNPVIAEIDVQGAIQLERKIKNTVTIFLKPDSIGNLIRRINQRGKMSEPELARRFASMEKEMKLAPKFDYRVINRQHKLPQAVARVSQIIAKHLP